MFHDVLFTSVKDWPWTSFSNSRKQIKCLCVIVKWYVKMTLATKFHSICFVYWNVSVNTIFAYDLKCQKNFRTAIYEAYE